MKRWIVVILTSILAASLVALTTTSNQSDLFLGAEEAPAIKVQPQMSDPKTAIYGAPNWL